MLGILIARGIAASIGALISDVYGVAQRADELATSPRLLVARAGASASSPASWPPLIPARSAARVDPVQALQKGSYQVLSAGESRVRAILAAVLGVVSIVCLTMSGSRPVFLRRLRPGDRGGAAAGPAAVAATGASSFGPLLKWIRPVEGALAADSLIQAPRRTSASVAALMLSLALVVAFAGMARASYDSIIDWMDDGAESGSVRHAVAEHRRCGRFVFPPTMGPRDRGDSGRRAGADGARRAHHVPEDAGDDRRHRRREHVRRRCSATPVAGDADEMYRETAAGEGLMVSDNLAQLQQLPLGDVLEMPAPSGVIRLPIVGIIVDYSDQQGTILMDRTRVHAVLERRLGERVSRLSDSRARTMPTCGSGSSSDTPASGRCSC